MISLREGVDAHKVAFPLELAFAECEHLTDFQIVGSGAQYVVHYKADGVPYQIQFGPGTHLLLPEVGPARALAHLIPLIFSNRAALIAALVVLGMDSPYDSAVSDKRQTAAAFSAKCHDVTIGEVTGAQSSIWAKLIKTDEPIALGSIRFSMFGPMDFDVVEFLVDCLNNMQKVAELLHKE
jgi:hypothetical protein